MVIYISYDGLCEPLGQSQVYQYILKLSKVYGHKYHLITYEKPHDLENQQLISQLRDELAKNNITWHVLRYHKRPTAIATSFDILMGFSISMYLCFTRRIHFIHTRSYVPSVIALLVKKILGVPFLFDMRGFWADEKKDSGSWPPQSTLYKLAKWFEKKFLLNADRVVSLTQSGVETMRKFDYLSNRPESLFRVIPTCVNLELFHSKASSPAPQSKPFVVGYVGSTQLWYMFEPTLQCFLEIKKRIPSAHLLIINRGEHDYILSQLQKQQISTNDYTLKACSHKEVVQEMQKMHLTVFFIRPTFSKIASAPTKLGEFLACGVPCITNPGVGDLDRIITKEKVGLMTHADVLASAQNGFREVLEPLTEFLNDSQLKERCVRTAHKYFSLDEAVRKYNDIYNEIIQSR